MAALPYIQIYVADYLADTMHLTAEEHGAYLLLIFNYWQTGKPIPKTRLQKIARIPDDRWTTVEESLSEFFTDDGERWIHDRIERDLDAVRSAQEQRANAGKRSAEARKASKSTKRQRQTNDRSTTVEDSLNEDSTNKDTDTDTDTEEKKCPDASDDAPARDREPEPEPEPQQQPDLDPEPPKNLTKAEFEDFWAACRKNWFGKPGAKQEALAQFCKIKRGDVDPQTLTDLALKDCNQRLGQHRREGFAEAMKHVCRWLKNRCWEDMQENPASGPRAARPTDEVDDYVNSAMAQARRSAA